jgi:hypothetical protein
MKTKIALAAAMLLSVSCLKRGYNGDGSKTLDSSAGVGMYLRGSHNNWAAEPMLYNGYYSARDIITFSGCKTVEFKFDLRGDWSENYGDNDNVRGFNPGSNRMEGRLDRNGGNISLECGKTYFVSMEYPHGSDAYYGFRELKTEVPSTLPEGKVVAFRKAVHGGGQYGSENFTGELLVKPAGTEKQSFKIRITSPDGPVESDQVKLEKTLPSGLQIWRFAVGSYGNIKFDSIVYRSGTTDYPVEINNDLIQ